MEVETKTNRLKILASLVNWCLSVLIFYFVVCLCHLLSVHWRPAEPVAVNHKYDVSRLEVVWLSKHKEATGWLR